MSIFGNSNKSVLIGKTIQTDEAVPSTSNIVVEATAIEAEVEDTVSEPKRSSQKNIFFLRSNCQISFVNIHIRIKKLFATPQVILRVFLQLLYFIF